LKEKGEGKKQDEESRTGDEGRYERKMGTRDGGEEEEIEHKV
jgi:hypothetical protein